MEGIVRIADWFDGLEEPLIIAGPCSAESKKQVLDTATGLSKDGRVNVFRAGVWKPRTRPGQFEGRGVEALSWLKEVKAQTGLHTATEVAEPAHVEAALNAGIDILWIGARTTSNPFSVQSLANVLKGHDIPVLVKNPINPDLALWMGALERFYSAGLRKLGAVHRGFYPFEPTPLRNIPKWELAIELQSRLHELPVICDPSHISGHPQYIADISQRALDINMRGLMVEVHNQPDIALSDARQQITPKAFLALLDELQFRDEAANDPDFFTALDALRSRIDSIDQQMLELLSKRMEVVEEIAKVKDKRQVSVLQLRRWEEMLKNRTLQGEELGLREDFIRKILQLVHKESIMRQTEVMQILKKAR